MSSVSRWLWLSYAVAAILGTLLVSQFIDWVFVTAKISDPLAQIIPLATLIGLMVGLAIFLVLLKHPRVNEFSGEVVKEISKVSWPTFLETRVATIVVIVLTIILVVVLGLLDWFFSSITNLIYR